LYLDLPPPSCSCTSGKGKTWAKETNLGKELITKKKLFIEKLS